MDRVFAAQAARGRIGRPARLGAPSMTPRSSKSWSGWSAPGSRAERAYCPREDDTVMAEDRTHRPRVVWPMAASRDWPPPGSSARRCATRSRPTAPRWCCWNPDVRPGGKIRTVSEAGYRGRPAQRLPRLEAVDAGPGATPGLDGELLRSDAARKRYIYLNGELHRPENFHVPQVASPHLAGKLRIVAEPGSRRTAARPRRRWRRSPGGGCGGGVSAAPGPDGHGVFAGESGDHEPAQRLPAHLRTGARLRRAVQGHVPPGPRKKRQGRGRAPDLPTAGPSPQSNAYPDVITGELAARLGAGVRSAAGSRHRRQRPRLHRDAGQRDAGRGRSLSRPLRPTPRTVPRRGAAGAGGRVPAARSPTRPWQVRWASRPGEGWPRLMDSVSSALDGAARHPGCALVFLDLPHGGADGGVLLTVMMAAPVAPDIAWPHRRRGAGRRPPRGGRHHAGGGEPDFCSDLSAGTGPSPSTPWAIGRRAPARKGPRGPRVRRNAFHGIGVNDWRRGVSHRRRHHHLPSCSNCMDP